MAADHRQHTVFKMKKEPRQARSRASVEAMLQASARILERRGYAGLSTNAVAEVAGVSIGSVYEYFPGKEAIVARLAESLLAETTDLLQGRLAMTDQRSELNVAMRHFLGALHALMHQHRRLLRVLVFQVPYLHQLPATRKLQQELQTVLQEGLRRTQEQYRVFVSPTTLYLMSTSAAGTLMHMVLMAPPSMEVDPVLDALAETLSKWLLES